MFHCRHAEIVYNYKIVDEYYKLGVVAQEIAECAHPGQFIHIRVSEEIDPLLRRPFSIHSVQKRGIIEIIYKVVGKGTAILSTKNSGGYLDIIGPLGNTFHLLNGIAKKQQQLPILVGGGYGISPLYFLADRFLSYNTFSVTPIVLIGAKTKKLILCKDELEKLGCKVKVSTEDGTEGYKGLVTNLLKEVLLGYREYKIYVYACGPQQMLKEVVKITNDKKITCQVSLEQNMACGIGACLGCVVKVKSKKKSTPYIYKRVCKDGPVFNAEEIVI